MGSRLQTHVIDLKRTEKQILSIRLAPDGFSFSIHDPLSEGSFYYQEERFDAGGVFEEAFQQAVFRNEVLLQDYRKSYVLFSGAPFTLVPAACSVPETLSGYYDFCFPSHREKVVVNRLLRNEADLLFGVAPSLHAFLMRTFPDAVLVHALSALSEYFRIQSPGSDYVRLCAQFYRERLDLLCFGPEGLRLANSFPCRALTDAAYYILQVWQQLGLRTDDELRCFASPDREEELDRLLQPYIANRRPLRLPGRVYELGRETLSAPFDLIALTLCEL